MKKSCFLVLLIAVTALFAEEPAVPAPEKQEKKESSSREVYGQVYRTLAMASFSTGYKEAALRKGSFGLGISGSLILRVENWTPSTFREGFGNLEVNYWASEFFNFMVSGGYHTDPGGSSVVPISGAVQFVIPEIFKFEKNPGLIGIELGGVYYSSAIEGESRLCFKAGLITYQPYDEHALWFNSVSWISPNFRESNWEWKTGFKYFFF